MSPGELLRLTLMTPYITAVQEKVNRPSSRKTGNIRRRSAALKFAKLIRGTLKSAKLAQYNITTAQPATKVYSKMFKTHFTHPLVLLHAHKQGTKKGTHFATP